MKLPVLSQPSSIIIKIKMSEGIVSVPPHIICADGCGSCVVVTVYDTRTRIGGIAHIMLPCILHVRGSGHKAKGSRIGLLQSRSPEAISPFQYADTGIEALLREMLGKGASIKNMVAKMAGGARMFEYYKDKEISIGEMNIECIKGVLKRMDIPLIGKDIGGSHGRNVVFYLDSGRVLVKALNREGKEI